MVIPVAIVCPCTCSLAAAAFTIYQELKHEHHEKHIFPHMKQRHKAFPWKESDCDLFDMHCKHAARGQLH